MVYKIQDHKCIPCCDYCHFYVHYFKDGEFTGEGMCTIHQGWYDASDGCYKFKCRYHDTLSQKQSKEKHNFINKNLKEKCNEN
jgi:hypothetical protein